MKRMALMRIGPWGAVAPAQMLPAAVLRQPASITLSERNYFSPSGQSPEARLRSQTPCPLGELCALGSVPCGNGLLKLRVKYPGWNEVAPWPDCASTRGAPGFSGATAARWARSAAPTQVRRHFPS